MSATSAPSEIGCFSLSEAALLLGVSRQTLHEGLRRYGLLRRCHRSGRYRQIGIDVLDLYRAYTEPPHVERRTKVPPGYLTTKAAAAWLRCHPSLLYRAARRGDLTVVRVGATQHYARADLERLRFALNETPPPGWIEVTAFAAHRGQSPTNAHSWLARHGHECRRYRRRRDLRLVTCARCTALEAWGDTLRQRAALKSAGPPPPR